MRHITMNIVRQNIVRMLVLCMVMCGVVGAWGQTALEKIGAEDFTTSYLGAESNATKQTLEGDGTVHFKFVNHNNNTTDNYKNFILVVRSEASPEPPLITLRADNWEVIAWSNAGLTNDFDWSNFGALMNGATVDMNITRLGTTFKMTSTITTTSNQVYNYNYTKDNLATGSITVGLSVENAYLDVYEAVHKVLPSIVTDGVVGEYATMTFDGIPANSTVWYKLPGDADFSQYTGAEIKVTETTNIQYKVKFNNAEESEVFTYTLKVTKPDAPEEWSINFSEIGTRNNLADKAGASIGAEVSNGMGKVTLGEALHPNFGIQTGTSWIYRTGSKGLYSSNSGGRNFGVFNAVKDQFVTVDVDMVLNPTNARLLNTNGNVRTFMITADGTVTFNVARYATIYSISVTNPILADYTLKYVDEHGAELKSVVTHGISWGNALVLEDDKQSFRKEDVKYIYVSDDSEGKLINDDGSTVVTITCRVAKTFSYTINLNYAPGQLCRELKHGTATEGDEVAASYPKYILNETTHKLYSLDPMSDNNKQYAVKFNLNEDNYVHNLDYTETDIDSVVCLIEAEDVVGLTFTNYVGNGTRTSMGGCAYPEKDTKLISGLPTGEYELTAFAYNNTSDNNIQTLTANIDGIMIWDYSTNATGLGFHTSNHFGIKDESKAIMLPTQGSQSVAFDFFYIRRVGDFEGTPFINQNLKDNYKVEVESALPLYISANHVGMYKWYEWNGDAAEYDPKNPDLTKALLIGNANTNVYQYRSETTTGTKSFFCELIGFGTTVNSNLAVVETVDKIVGGAALTKIETIDYNNTAITNWKGSSNNKIESQAAVIANTQTGNRASWLDLASAFAKAPSSQDGAWILDYDFCPGNVNTGSPQGFAIYSTAVGMPRSNYNYAPETSNVFFGLNAPTPNDNNYVAYVGGIEKGNVALTPNQWHHVHLKVTNTTIHVELTNTIGRVILFTYDTDTPLANGMALGGIHQYIPRNAGSSLYDNISIQVLTAQPMININIPEFLEGNDDYYLNDGDGLNFNVPAATTFEWYYSTVAPSKTGDGTETPKIEEDGSITWTGHNAFMTVESPVDRSSTAITKTKGVATVTDPGAEGKHVVDVVTRGKDVTDAEWFRTNGCYADTLLKSGYTHVQTVWDEATKVTVGDNTIYRYYPEATASGSRWHYLRQLWVPTEGESGAAESDHVDYVWCVATNALGEVTSKVSQITIYPMQPQIYLEEDYFTDDEKGARADMTLPAIYKFRNYGVKIHTNNLIFNTPNMKVPYATRSYIHYKDKVSGNYVDYDPDTEVMGTGTKWLNNGTPWTGVISTTAFSGFDTTLEKNASVHGFYKSMPMPLPVNFTYGLLQQQPGVSYHDITKDAEKNSIAEYIIGPTDNSSLQATQNIHFDYGRYTSAEVPLGTVSEKTTWDWSTLPERKFLTYNIGKYTAKSDTLHTIDATTYVVDPETGLGGPVMGTEYVMANFYGYSTADLSECQFPSDKVSLGLEYVNEPEAHCMQGNAFIIKPQHSGTLELRFSSTDSNAKRYLELCTRDDMNGTDVPRQLWADTTVTSNGNRVIKDITIKISDEMVADGKLVVIRARNSKGVPANGLNNQYFRIYTATYTPDADPVTFTEWKVKDRPVGGQDEYVEPTSSEKSDGFVRLNTTTPDAVIKYKVLTGTDKNDDAIAAFMNTDEYKNLETQTYKEDVYKDPNNPTIKIGIHCAVNSTIFAWTEMEGMNPSEVTWHKTNAAVYPVDMRYMKDFDNSTITTQEAFDKAYWDASGQVRQSDLSSYTDLSVQENIDKLKSLSTPDAPKPWKSVDSEGNPIDYGKAFIDGVEYTEANFDKFFITHGTTIDIFINPESKYEFAGWGAPSFSGSAVSDMMRSGAKAKHVHYHLLYDKAKAATTAGIAFLIANFTDRTETLTANILMKPDTGDGESYNIPIPVNEEDMIIAPVYHSAHNADGMTVTHWTDEYGLGDDGVEYENYLPGQKKRIYEDTQIKPVYRNNAVADNYRGRSVPMTATWWFTTDHNAQPLAVGGEREGFTLPYVTPVRRHQIGTADEFLSDGVTPNPDDLWFDFPMTITPYTNGRLNNSVNPDWCAVGRGITFTMPACKDAEVRMEVRSAIIDVESGTKFAGETPVLDSVLYRGDKTFTHIDADHPVDAKKTVESYIYKSIYKGDAETLDIVIGSDYSYIRNISLTMPVVISKRDAALITLDFSQLLKHLTPESYDPKNTTEDARFPVREAPLPYGEGVTGDGYEFDHKSVGKSLYRTHYSKEDGAIYYSGVSRFMVGTAVPDSVPYVNGETGYTYSTENGGTFIVGPFRSITHIRYKQGSSDLSGGGWTIRVGRKQLNLPKNEIQTNKTGNINEPSDPRRQYDVASFSDVTWSAPKDGSISNSTTPVWLEMDIEENMGVDKIESEGYDEMQGDIWLKFEADKPNVYLFAIEVYGIDPTSDQQVTLETSVALAESDDDDTYTPSFLAGNIFHFPYLLQLDDSYQIEATQNGENSKVMQFNEGREVTLTATPNPGYEFQKWVVFNDDTGKWDEVSRQNPYAFNIDVSCQVCAVFVHRGIINYTSKGAIYGIMPDQMQTDTKGGFTVAENRSLFAEKGQSLRSWQDSEPDHPWYSAAGTGVQKAFAVSTNTVSGSTASVIERSRGEMGVQVDVYPEFTANTLSLLDIVGRKGATARWKFGKKNGAPTMEDKATPRLVTQVSIAGTKDVYDKETNSVKPQNITDIIDVNLEINGTVNNAGRADKYASVRNGAEFTLPATKGIKIELGANGAIDYSINGGNYLPYSEPFRLYLNDPTIRLKLRNHDNQAEQGTLELEYIQATYYQRAQTPVLSMQSVDVIPSDGHTPSNNVQVQVQTNSNPAATRFYTLDGSDPQYIEQNGTFKPANNSTRQVRGNYITINETQIGSGTTLKVLSVCADRADSEIASLDLEPYNPSLGLATYVYDSRIIDIHEDQIFRKLKAEHKGHFNLLSYDLNPYAARIPDIITDHTTVFITSEDVRSHLLNALTDPSDGAAHGQVFNIEPLIVGTPLTISWKEKATTGDWQNITWQNKADTIAASNTITYTEWMRDMKNSEIRKGTEIDPDLGLDVSRATYADYYKATEQITGADDYILTFFDGMLLDDSKLCISETTSLEPQYLSYNGTQLVYNATELLTRITMVDGTPTPANVSTFGNVLLTLMAPTPHPQLVNIKLTDTFHITDQTPGDDGKVTMTPQMLSALSDGLAVMPQSYLAGEYPQFTAKTVEGKGKVDIINVETWDGTGSLATDSVIGAQGVRDLATVITLTDPDGDKDFKRVYRVEYNVPLDSITFSKTDDGTWVCNETPLFSITETKDKDEQPVFRIEGPVNMGIKDVCFNGYAIAPADKFDDPKTGELKPDEDGQHKYSIWGRGEKYDESDEIPSPTAYSVTGTFLPEYPAEGYEGEIEPNTGDKWMESHFPWGFKDCHRMAFTLLNVTEYHGDIKVRFYRKQSEAPELVSTNIHDDMTVPANGVFTMEFNTVMHQVRVPGKYEDANVVWTAHIIPDDLGNGISYGDINEKEDHSKIDQYDTKDAQILLSAEGGTNTLTFHYWHLEQGKKYWLHIPFHILRSDVGQGYPYQYPDGEIDDANEYEKNMSWTNYEDTNGEKVPYFDIPFTVETPQYNHDVFDYIVSRDNWWDAYKESGSAAPKMPSYATWDGDFAKGINSINSKKSSDRFYMHVQKNLAGNYSLGADDAGKIEIKVSNFSIVGEGSDSTRIYAKTAAVSGDNTEGLREGNNTATLHIDGNEAYLQDLAIENAQEGNGNSGQEYPALFSHGDKNTFYGLDIKAYEESFATFGTLGYLENCRISGYGDFVTGNGDVWLDSCQLVLRDRSMVNLCAPASKATDKWGFVFNNCHIDREAGAGNVVDHNWTLARPWGGYDTEVLKSPAVTFIDTKLTVLPTNSGYGARTPGLHLRFHEYGTYKNNVESPAPLGMRSVAGCSPDPTSDYPVLSKEQTDKYSIENVFGRDHDGYDPQTLTRQAKAPVLVNDDMVLHWKADPSDLCYLVYYLGDGDKPDWENALMFCCVPGTNDAEAYCYLTDHDKSPIFRTKENGTPVAFTELWYGKRNVDGVYTDPLPEGGMGKGTPTRLWYAVRAANQMGGLSPMSNALMYHAARQYRTSITSGGVRQGDDSGNAYSTIYLDFQAIAPEGVKAYALTKVSTEGFEGTSEATLTFTRVSNSTDPNHRDAIYADQGYLIYGPYGKEEGLAKQDYIFVESTSYDDNYENNYLDGTVGEFLNKVTGDSPQGELNGVREDIGWSINPVDYKNVARGNVVAYTLQNHDSKLGFYKYTSSEFQHHRAYLDIDVAAEVLVHNEGISKQDADNILARGMRIVIVEDDGTVVDITSAFINDSKPEGIYDLTGRKIEGIQHLKKGSVYIIEGQKVLWDK